MFVDSHCHLFSEYYDDINEIVENSSSKGISYLINNGCNSKSNKEIIDLISKYKNMYGAIGIHPEDVDNYSLDDINFIVNNLNNKKIIAIGEIGLDYYYTKENKDKQIELFERQLEIAEHKNIPVIVHSRDATQDTINILKKYKVKGVIHSFSGSKETAKEYIKMGFLLGINGVITFKNCNIKDVYKEIGLNNVIFETDSPYLTPVPFRGKKNDPSKIIDIVDFISNEFCIPIQELSKISNKNVQDVFGINVEK